MTEPEKLLREIISLASVNPAFLPPRHPNAGEKRVSDFLASIAAAAGLDIDFQKVAPQRHNLLVSLPPTGAARHRLLLAPHLDTVNAAPEQFQPLRRKGRLYGRGACDTKGSVVAMLAALCAVAKSGTRPAHTEIVFVGLVDEENAQSGSRALAGSGFKADLAVVGEPTRNKVVNAHKGSLWLELQSFGKAAHGAEPDAGRNAIHAMARIVDLLETEYRRALKKRRHPLLGAATCSVGTISGGTQANIVPDSCGIVVDRRTLPGETERGVIQEMSRFLKQHGIKARISSCKQAPCLPLETDSTLPFVTQLLDCAGQRQGLGAQYFCDASVLAQGGIPSVVFGPGDIAQAHTADEWISLSSLEDATRILQRFLRSLP